MRNLIGRHGRIPDKDHFIVVAVFMQNVKGVDTLVHTPAVLFPHAVINKIVKVVGL